MRRKKPIKRGRCAYCGVRLYEREVDLPALDDDRGWSLLAWLHLPTCEWVLTRAHRVFAGGVQ